MASGLSRIIAAGLLFSGLIGLKSDFLQQYVFPEMWSLWSLARFAPVALALVYLAVLKHHHCALSQALILLPAIITTMFLERISLPMNIEWLIGLPLAYQEFDLLLWLCLTTTLCAHYLRRSQETNQPVEYTRRLLLTLSMICMLGIWLLPVMGDTLLARSERWVQAWQTGSLSFQFPHHTPVSFWLETVGLSLPIILLGLQTALIRNPKSRHRWACIMTFSFILLASAIRAEAQSGEHSLIWLSLRAVILFVTTALLASVTAAKAWLLWHLPIPSRSPGDSPSLRAELLDARMTYQENHSSGPAYRKSVKRLVDRCHRALEREAKEKNHPASAWINHRLQAGSESTGFNPENSHQSIGQAPRLHHYLARGRRLEIVLLSWFLLVATGWSEWRVHQPFTSTPPGRLTPFESSKLWKQGLKAGLLNTPGDKNAVLALARHIAPNLKQDIIWKLRNMKEVHGVEDVGNIFETMADCSQSIGLEMGPESCRSINLIEPLILTILDTLEQARLRHLAQLTKTWRAPQMVRDLTQRHPDLDALELSREISSQLAALQVRFMARTGLFALILAADQQPKSIAGEAATIILNLLAPSKVLYERLYEDTRRLSARASGLYTTIFGRSIPAGLDQASSGGEEPLGLLK